MKRYEFIEQLNRYLKGISTAERNDVISYYNEMFDDANLKDQDEVPRSFGDPKTIALEILTDEDINRDGADYNIDNKRRRNNTLMIIFLVLLAAPFALPIALLLLGLAFAFFMTICALIFAVFVVMYSLFTTTTALMTKIFFIGSILIMIGAVILLIEFFSYIVSVIGKKVSGKRRADYEEKY
ncbi:MAG: DUF1700 domain-containing protein [Tissierellia bacterium]|nr:DUF1700 domain-containing protein [Tissierellia bacterium]